MAAMLDAIWEKCNFVLYELNDDRSRDLWPNAYTVLFILIVYLCFVKKAGPAWMKERQPFQLKNTILVYNLIQIIVSAYLFYEGITVWIFEYNWMCEPFDLSTSPAAMKTLTLTRLYFILKIVDLLDTVFFVLRKKDRQISALHIYHHFMMPICAWMGLKYFSNGHGTLLGVINCLVHTVMYTYYLISGLGPQYQKYLWWKKHVTTMQLTQFAIIFVHNVTALIVGCNYPKWINWTLSACSLHFVYMFGNFYYENYIKNQNTNKKHDKRN